MQKNTCSIVELDSIRETPSQQGRGMSFGGFEMEQQQQEHERYDQCDEEELISRRAYLISLKKWSKAVIGGILLGGALSSSSQEAQARSWVNNRGGGGAWANNYGGGRAWANRRGGWGNGGWINNRGGWGNGGWRNSSGGWGNSSGGWRNGGANWVNRS